MDYAAGGAPACRRTLQGEGRPVLEEVKEAAAEGLKLPKDESLGEMLLTVVGSRSVTVENYRGILFYDEETVTLKGRRGKAVIRGRGLHIDYYDQDEMRISGTIRSLELGG